MVGERAGRTAVRAQRRRPADRRPRPRRRAAPAPPGVTYFGIEDPSPGAARAPARPRRQALPPLRRALRLRAGLRRPPRPLQLPQLRRRPARARRRRDRDRAARDARLDASSVRTPAGEAELELPLPGLYNVYNALAALAAALRLGRRRSSTAARALESMRGGVRAGRDDRRRGHAGLDPADQEPGRRERGPAHAAPRGRRRTAAASTSGSRSTTGSPTAATSPGSGTPTSSCSPGACARVICAGTRAPEMAVRLKYAGLDPASDRGRAVDRALARPRRRRRRRAALRPAHLHGADRAAHGCSPRAAWRRSTGDERRAAPRPEP